MKTIIIFLRGINVNGINIRMNELSSVVESMMYVDVKTILATGNVIAKTSDDKISIEEHKNKIEAGISNYFGCEANIFIKTAKQIQDIVEESKNHEVPEGYHHYILLNNNNIGTILKTLFERCNKASNEQLILDEHGIYWIVPKGETLQSEFGKQVLGKKKFRSIVTSRTINTIHKISKCL